MIQPVSTTGRAGGHPSTPTEETYFCMFSSTVPVQLVPSIWQAFHDGMAQVLERMSATTSELSSSVSPTDDPPPALVVGSRVCAEPPACRCCHYHSPGVGRG